MSRYDQIKKADEILSRELSDLLNENESIAAKRRRFMESEEVKKHIEQHKDPNATLFFPEFYERKEGIESIAAEHFMKEKKNDELDFSVKKEGKNKDGIEEGSWEADEKLQKDAKFSGYQSNAAQGKFSGYISGDNAEAGDLYGQNKDLALCSCGCSFEMDGNGNVSTSAAVPGQEGNSSYGGVSKQGNEGYSAANTGGKVSYGGFSSGKVKYGH